jgi:hypothetical protein
MNCECEHITKCNSTQVSAQDGPSAQFEPVVVVRGRLSVIPFGTLVGFLLACLHAGTTCTLSQYLACGRSRSIYRAKLARTMRALSHRAKYCTPFIQQPSIEITFPTNHMINEKLVALNLCLVSVLYSYIVLTSKGQISQLIATDPLDPPP